MTTKSNAKKSVKPAVAHPFKVALDAAKLTHTYTVQTFREIFDGAAREDYDSFVSSLSDDELIEFMDDAASFNYALPDESDETV